MMFDKIQFFFNLHVFYNIPLKLKQCLKVFASLFKKELKQRFSFPCIFYLSLFVFAPGAALRFIGFMLLEFPPITSTSCFGRIV